MPDTAWKRWEREVATDLGGYRTGPQGSNVPDVSGVDGLAPECKCYATLALKGSDMEQAERNARGKPWALFLRARGRGGRKVVVMPYTHWLALWRAAHPGDIHGR